MAAPYSKEEIEKTRRFIEIIKFLAMIINKRMRLSSEELGQKYKDYDRLLKEEEKSAEQTPQNPESDAIKVDDPTLVSAEKRLDSIKVDLQEILRPIYADIETEVDKAVARGEISGENKQKLLDSIKHAIGVDDPIDLLERIKEEYDFIVETAQMNEDTRTERLEKKAGQVHEGLRQPLIALLNEIYREREPSFHHAARLAYHGRLFESATIQLVSMNLNPTESQRFVSETKKVAILVDQQAWRITSGLYNVVQDQYSNATLMGKLGFFAGPSLSIRPQPGNFYGPRKNNEDDYTPLSIKVF